MSASVTTHQATGIKFRTGSHDHGNGGWLTITVPHGDSIMSVDDVYIHTSSPAVLDHFRDIERVANGPIGSLRPKPPEEEAPQDGNPTER